MKSDNIKQIMGLWDSNRSQICLGGLVLLSAMLKAKALLQNASIEGICFIGNDFDIDDDKVVKMTKADCEQSVLFSALLNFEGIESCYRARTQYVVEEFAHDNTEWSFFPTICDLNSNVFHHGMYESTLFLQQFFREHKFVPNFKMDTGPVKWAIDLIDECILPSLPVVVHLKNNLLQKNCSNARFDEWEGFFKMCIGAYDVKFIVIGNEEIDRSIADLSNVLVTNRMRANLSQELALIEIAYAFIGMSSGPCNVAICSDIPYIIYKNPSHHAEAMILELGNNEGFPFATPYQKFLRMFESGENLFSNFNHILDNYKREEWKSRISYVDEKCRR